MHPRQPEGARPAAPPQACRAPPSQSAAQASIAASSTLRRALSYRKFVPNRPLKVLVLESAYHLQGECKRALEALGHNVMGVNVRLEDAAQVVRALLAALVAHRPDFVLCINHLGFDEGGTVGALLEALEVPVACWYVDSPFFVLRGSGPPANAVTSLFIWEQALIPTLRALGAQDVHYLPLACEPAAFGHAPATKARYPIGFVGNSMEVPGKKWTQALPAAQRARAATWQQRLIAERCNLVDEVLALGQEHAGMEVWNALASATYAATGHYRAQLLRPLCGEAGLHVFGDAHWKDVLPNARLHPQVHYGTALAQVYRRTAININATSLQMPTAVNQRVFDVPCAGGFLLTDAQSDVALHFELGREVITFDGPEHLQSLARFYRAHPALRAAVVANAHARILAEHTYVHRLRCMLDVMVRRHRPQFRPTALGGSPCRAAPS